MTIWTGVIVLALVALNGLFVAAEFAIVGAPKASIDRLARQGHRLAAAVGALLENPRAQDRLIATAQLGITLASLGLGMFGEHALALWLAPRFESLGVGQWMAAHTLASAVSITVLTYLHIVLGEMVPKSVALQRAQRTVLWIVPLMRVVQLVLYPLVVGLNGLGNGVLALLGVRRERTAREHYLTPEELTYLVRETVAGGLLRKESAHIVQEVIEFGGLTARQVMVPRVRVLGLPAGASRDAIRKALATRAHTRYPVYEGTLDRIVGVVHVKDLLRCLTSGAALAPEAVRRAPFVTEAAEMDKVLAAMNGARSQLAVVRDEQGGTAGVVTVEDLFEEVVGELRDDPRDPGEAMPETGGHVRVPGTARLDEVGAALGVVLEHGDVETVGGLVLMLLGRPPAVGDVVTYDQVRFEVTAVRGRGVDELRVRKAP